MGGSSRSPGGILQDSAYSAVTDRAQQAAAEARAELDRRSEDYRWTLSQLRNARRLTQVQLAAILGVSQAQVSRMENQADLYLSTLRSYVQAMGGELELRAVFPDGHAAAITLAARPGRGGDVQRQPCRTGGRVYRVRPRPRGRGRL
jgi:DNA-binding XRE family transcriptional regulator